MTSPPTRTPRRRAVVALLVAVGSTLAGCGLPDDRDPRVITAQEAPLDLDESAGGNESESGNARATLYFVLEGVLAEVVRPVTDNSLETALGALLDRPTTEEANEGYRSEIPAETELIDADVDLETGIATINLGCAPGDDPTITLPSNCGVQGAQGTAQLTLFAQLVCTATEVPGTESVLFLQEGTPQPAPIDGGISTEPVRCSDYRSVRQPG
jgi:spore germination protein GerM